MSRIGPRKLNVWTLVFVISICFASSTAIAGTSEIGYGSVGPNSLFSQASDPTNSPASTESVNLYSGQHVESFPLMTLAGRGGMGVRLSLDYNGNIGHIAKAENRTAQVSPFGLGFSIGRQSILVNHGGTSYLYDDTYTLILGNAVLGLKHIPSDTTNDSFITQRGDPWIITRQTTKVDKRYVVIGWELVREDGTVYQFGDWTTNPASLNATRNILRYGNYVGNGVTQDDSLYFFQWDIKTVHDPENLNWIKYNYSRDEAYLVVINPNNPDDTVSSLNTYTRASYIDSITTSAGDKLEFSYTSRNDFHQYLGINNYEFYADKKVSQLKSITANGSILSRIVFTYDYLNHDKDSTLQKLILKAITPWTADSSNNLPTTSFEYYSDPTSISYGCIERVYFPTGSMKDVNYHLVPDSANFTDLDLKVDSGITGSGFKRSFGNNLSIDKLPDNSVRLAIWDGYWQVETIPFATTVNRVQASHQNWGMAHIGGSDIVVFRWMHGYWAVDTLPDKFTIYGSNIWDIEMGKDCFFVATGDSLVDKPKRLRRANFYYWTGAEWKGEQIVHALGSSLFDGYDVRLGDKLYALSVYDSGSSFLAGKFDAERDTLNSIVANGIGGVIQGIVAGNDAVGFSAHDPVRMYFWEDSVWSAEQTFSTGGREVNSLVAIPNGILWSYSNSDGTNTDRISYFYGSGHSTGLVQLRYLVTDQLRVQPSYTSGNSYTIGDNIVLQDNHKWIRNWNGMTWQWTVDLGTGAGDLLLFPNSYYHLGGDVVSRFNRNNLDSTNVMWSSPQSMQLSDSAFSPDDIHMALTEDFAVGYRRHRAAGCNTAIYDTTLLYRWSAFQGDQYLQFPVRSWNGMSCITNLNVNRREFFAGQNSFYETQQWTSGVHDTYLNRIIDTLFTGKALLIAVSSIVLYNGAEDSNPVVVDYAYNGGLLDQQGNTPRFARVTVSTPHYLDSLPEGYSASYFYNDIDRVDSAQFGNLNYPNLKDSVRYGIANGGYRLDGLQYRQYSYNYNRPDSIIDNTLSFHSLRPTPEGVFEVYRIQADSSITYSEGFTDTTYQYYDSATGLPTSSKRRAGDGISFVIDSTVYAIYGPDSTSVKASHELSLPYERTSILDVAGAKSTLSRTRTYYQQEGFHRPKATYSWIDASSVDTADAVRTFTTYGVPAVCYDAFGNLKNSQDAIGVVSSVKYDSAGALAVASASNVPSYGFLSQDFEQGNSWDGWNCKDGTSYIQFDTDAFTGLSSILITDAVGGNRNWGPEKYILADSLTDSLYAFSVWVKTNHAISIYCWGMDGVGATLSDGYKYKLYSDITLPDNEWTLISDTFDLSAVLRDTSFSKIKLELNLEAGADGVDYANFDDFRFHPISSPISATVYDSNTKLPVAKAGTNNYPGRSYYDEFNRLIRTSDYRDTTLSYNSYPSFPGYRHAGLSHLENEIGVQQDTIVVDTAGFVYYTLTFRSLTDSGASSWIALNGGVVRGLSCSIPPPACSDTVRDSFAVVAGNAISFRSQHLDDSGFATVSFAYPSKSGGKFYRDVDPNYVTSTTYDATGAPSTAYAYYDALGRTLQTRSQAVVNDTLRTIVSGLAEYDARGKTTKSIMSYRDVTGATGLTDYTLPANILTEANAFYNGTYAPKCNGFPYGESKYAIELKSRLLETSGPDTLYNMASGKTSTYFQSIDLVNGEITQTTIDPDSIVSRSVSDRRGMYTKAISLFNNPTDSTITTSSRTLRGDSSFTAIDAGGSTFTLKTSTVDNLGREVSTWQKGYGKIEMVYDDAGQLRFMRNDKRITENKYVYFKYDSQGRKIEEGLIFDTLNLSFVRTGANNQDFPIAGDSRATVKYRWIYDQLPGQTPVNSLGKLVRVENADMSYYKEFTYYPGSDSDYVTVKLPIDSGSLKGIKHIYNRDGSLSRLEIHPDISDSTSYRAIEYDYNSDGGLLSLNEGVFDTSSSSLRYGAYTYNADGGVRRMLLGSVDNNSALQKVDYTYDVLGRLTAINRPKNSPLDALVGSVNGAYASTVDNDHYDLDLEFYDGTAGQHANGRPSSLRVRTSSPAGTILAHKTDLTYDDRGWLTKADDTANIADDREYTYNALGLRTQLKTGVTETNYLYDSNWRYLGTSFTTLQNQRKYDTLGNMIADSSLGILQQQYDYRNQLVKTWSTSLASGAAPDTLDFIYDQTQKRITKRNWYQYWSTCGGGGSIPPVGFNDESKMQFGGAGSEDSQSQLSLTGAGGGGPTPCLKIAVSETHYLYDAGVLVATFDESDNVRDLFVNGPGGRIASYQFNDSAKLIYYLNDHLGSPRGIVIPNPSAQMVSYTHFYPFGETLESWTSGVYNQFLYTGKERDQHGAFDYYYFGARYYDAKTGTFTSFDKAGQFPGGFRYGNDPIIGVDGDGNFFFLVPVLLAVADVAVAYANGEHDFWNLAERFVGSVAMSAATAGVGSLNIPGGIAEFADKTGGVLGVAARGLDYSLRAGKIAGAVNNGLNTFYALREGDLASAYGSFRLRDLDVGVAQAGFANAYLSLPVAWSNNYRASIGVWGFDNGQKRRSAFAFGGGILGQYVGGINAVAQTIGHNVLVNRRSFEGLPSNSSRIGESSKAETRRHEFEHVFQYENYGPSFVPAYFRDEFFGIVPEPRPRTLEWSAWYAAGQGANRFEYEAYLKGFHESGQGFTTNGTFWPW